MMETRRAFTPYRATRYDWPSGWYFEWNLDWRCIGFAAEASFGSQDIHGFAYGVDLQVGPLYVEGGKCRKHPRSTPAGLRAPNGESE